MKKYLVTLTTPKGNIVMHTVVQTTEFGRLPGSVSMTITKGTKHFKGISGSGSGSPVMRLSMAG